MDSHISGDIVYIGVEINVFLIHAKFCIKVNSQLSGPGNSIIRALSKSILFMVSHLWGNISTSAVQTIQYPPCPPVGIVAKGNPDNRGCSVQHMKSHHYC